MGPLKMKFVAHSHRLKPVEKTSKSHHPFHLPRDVIRSTLDSLPIKSSFKPNSGESNGGEPPHILRSDGSNSKSLFPVNLAFPKRRLDKPKKKNVLPCLPLISSISRVPKNNDYNRIAQTRDQILNLFQSLQHSLVFPCFYLLPRSVVRVSPQPEPIRRLRSEIQSLTIIEGEEQNDCELPRRR